MTFEEFDKVCEQMFKEVRVMRDTKGKEYARSKDRFDNFNRLARDLKVSREQILWVYTSKHLDGIVSYINNGCTFSGEHIHGRIKDVITYLLLLDGMIVENDRQGEIPTHQEQMDVLRDWTGERTWALTMPNNADDPRCPMYSSYGRCTQPREHMGEHRNDIG